MGCCFSQESKRIKVSEINQISEAGYVAPNEIGLTKAESVISPISPIDVTRGLECTRFSNYLNPEDRNQTINLKFSSTWNPVEEDVVNDDRSSISSVSRFASIRSP